MKQEDLGAARVAFERDGYAVVQNLIAREVSELRAELAGLVASVLSKAGEPADPDGDLDTLYDALCAADRSNAHTVFDLARHLPAALALAGSPALRDLGAGLLGSSKLVVPFEKFQFRADRPEEDWSLLDWHQDYPFNMVSQPTLTVWVPLTDVTPDMGPVAVAPGSHGQIEPVRFEMQANGFGRVRPVPTFPGFEDGALEDTAVAPPLSAGDLLVLHQEVAHRSGANRADRTRWSLQIRIGTLDCPAFADRSFAYERGAEWALFKSTHPDRVLEPLEGAPS